MSESASPDTTPNSLVRIGRSIHLGLRAAGIATVILLIVATGLGAIARYFHVRGVTWSFELVGMTFLWTTAIGAVLSEIVGENVSVDGTSRDRGAFFRVYHALVLLIVAAAMVWSGYAMLKRTGFMPTPVMRAPSWIVQSTIVSMGAALAVVALLRLFRVLR